MDVEEGRLSLGSPKPPPGFCASVPDRGGEEALAPDARMNRSVGFYLDQALKTSGDQAQTCQMPRLEDHCWSCSCASSAETKHSSGANWLASKAEEMMSIITSVLSNAYGSLHDVRTANLIRRGLVLFTVGASLALVLNLLQIQRNVTLFPEEVMTTLFSSAWWIPPCCGTGAAVVGLLYPCLDSHLGEPHKFKREWASVMRCIAVFVGINHASVKLNIDNTVQLSLTLAALSLGLWWTFDRSRSGLGLGITTAFLATVFTQLLVYNGVYQYTSPDFLYVRSWLPCIFFSGGVTVGNIGRQLAMGGVEKPHMD
ncbi:Insulin-induced gene 1 protein [Larimichthys crocea]|uniref:Insulin-induced gene protein n=2 Tax=Larimichthys crocea TaxID=215358 RepID=A0A6G0HKU0_LARCR|nr:Insulin-induced gene 1 protein [Larimichthys crocea]